MARDLVVTENITFDGVIDASEGWFDVTRTDPEGAAEMHEVEVRHREAADAVLLGRNTFEAFRSFWPHQTDDATGVSAYLDAVDKYVVSSTVTDPAWEHSTVLDGDLGRVVGELKEAPGKDIVVTGSITLVHGLQRAGLVDEYRLWVYPVVIGRGGRLFEPELPKHDLEPLEARRFPTGVTLLRFRVA